MGQLGRYEKKSKTFFFGYETAIRISDGFNGMLILFPSDFYNIKEVDSVYASEYEAVSKIPEFKTMLFNYDSFVTGSPLKIYPNEFYKGKCIYRGWMLTPALYGDLYSYLSL